MVVATAVGTATVGGFTGAGRLAGGCGISSRNCNSWWIHRCKTVSWWLWHHVGVESPTAVGGFTGDCGQESGLAGGCGSWWLWHRVGVESPAAVGGFTGAGLLAGGCGIVVSCGS